MRLANFDPKSNLSLADRAKGAIAYVCGEVFFWFGFLLAVWGATYSIYLGLAVFLGWVLLFVLMVRRELKRDIEALDDPNQLTRRRRNDMPLRFAVEFVKSIAIIIALTLGMGFAAEIVAFALSDRDVSGAFGSGLAGIAGGILGLVIAVVIVLRQIADIED
ncbi:hypothetical protein ACVWYH_002602 [Bradyrhizobium sp. GM24.11]